MTQNLVSTINCIRYGLASVHSVEKLSRHDYPLKLSSQIPRHTSVKLSQANSLVSLQDLYESSLFLYVKSVLHMLAILKTNTWNLPGITVEKLWPNKCYVTRTESSNAAKMIWQMADLAQYMYTFPILTICARKLWHNKQFGLLTGGILGG